MARRLVVKASVIASVSCARARALWSVSVARAGARAGPPERSTGGPRPASARRCARACRGAEPLLRLGDVGERECLEPRRVRTDDAGQVRRISHAGHLQLQRRPAREVQLCGGAGTHKQCPGLGEPAARRRHAGSAAGAVRRLPFAAPALAERIDADQLQQLPADLT